MTKQEMIELLILIESVYAKFILKNETVLSWLKYSQIMDYDKVMENLQHHIRRSPYPPTISDLIMRGAIKTDLPSILPEREQLDQQNRYDRPIPTWMLEYSLKKTFPL
ncbi:hypothetical protein KW850_15130 [Bacillus sp. sid0103]|uniref:hypothetical protein n=1 Tax=Bacillus sp. sid0103 TaxID=2856337 RepID=UPI001C45E757|nr:hypothetical protein [Bacillus sp. sid0103]MBV7506596.1 hypothetical protein [Bacillus sp. sid0103]